MAQETGDRQELGGLLRGFRTAMLTTRGKDGELHARPMALQKQAMEVDELWFATSVNTQKTHDLEADPDCGVAMFDTINGTYVSLSGEAEIVRDRAKIHELWEPDWKAWFPDGPDTPDLCLLRFRTRHAEYRHVHGGLARTVVTMVKNAVTHQRSEPAPKKELELKH